MHLVKSVRIQCHRCGARFAPPVQITDLAKLEEFAAWGGIIDCVECHHFIEVSRSNLAYVDANGNTRAVQMTPIRDSRKIPTAEDCVK